METILNQFVECSCQCGELIDGQEAVWSGYGARAKAYINQHHLEADKSVMDRFIQDPSANNYNLEDSLWGWE